MREIKGIVNLVLLILTIMFAVESVGAQSQASYWYFGYKAGIKFNNKGEFEKVLTNGALATGEGCATVSDYKGNLLFYTDGRTVYNKNHQVMTNGTGLKGHASSAQSAIVVPKPGVEKLYYVFTLAPHYSGTPDKLHYSVVDLTNGLGEVVEKNIPISDDLVVEKIAAIKHRNGKDFWVVVHRYGQSGYNKDFLVYSITKDGVKFIKKSLHEPAVGNTSSVGYLRFSKTNPSTGIAKLAMSCYHLASAYVYDFNTATGEISNAKEAVPEVATNRDPMRIYGVEFSPNSRYLYVTSNIDPSYRYDIENDKLEELKVFESGTKAIQIGPDRKIYVTNSNGYLDVINDPNNPDISSIGFKSKQIDLKVKIGSSLPQFVQDYLTAPAFEVEDVCQGNSVVFKSSNVPESATVIWNFGDGTSSTERNPSHLYSLNGEYKVELAVTDSEGTTNFSRVVKVRESAILNLGEDKEIVAGQSVQIGVDETEGATYSWTSTEELDCTDCAELTVSPNCTATYNLSVTHKNGCKASDEVTVSVLPEKLQITSSALEVVANTPVTLSVTNDYCSDYEICWVIPENKNSENGVEKDPVAPTFSKHGKYNLFGQLPTPWDSQGLPNYLTTNRDNISQELINEIANRLPEQTAVSPDLIDVNNESTIKLVKDAQIWVTFVGEGAGMTNALGFYTYDVGNPPTTTEDIADKLTIIFPNASAEGSNGSLVRGDKVYLGDFKAGTAVAWFLVGMGWENGALGDGIYTLYSNSNLNPESDSSLQQHNVLLKDTKRELIVIGFEDILRDRECDNDFNDVLFYASVEPFNAIDPDIPELELVCGKNEIIDYPKESGCYTAILKKDGVEVDREKVCITVIDDPDADPSLLFNVDFNNCQEIAVDYISGKTGVKNGSPTWTKGYKEQGVSLDGNSSFSFLGDSELTTPYDKMTISVWFKSNHDFISSVSNTNVLAFKDGNYRLSLSPAGSKLKPGFNLYLDGKYTDIGSNYADGKGYFDLLIEDQLWHNITCTYDGTEMKLFKDGELHLSKAVSGKVGKANGIISQADLFIGSTYTTSYASGIIDEVKIFNRALTDADVMNIAMESEYGVACDQAAESIDKKNMKVSVEESLSIIQNRERVIIQLPDNLTSGVYVQLIDGQGNILVNLNTDNSSVILNVGNYPKGVYVVRVMTDSGITTKKIITGKK